MDLTEFRATPSREFARTARMNLVWLHRCGKAVGYPTTVPIEGSGLTCDGCYPLVGPDGAWLGIDGRIPDTDWRALRWTDSELHTAFGVPELMEHKTGGVVPNFASTDGPRESISTDRHNRYLIPRYPLDRPMRPDEAPIKGTGMEVPWTRVSTILDTHEEKEGIFKWTKRLVVKGIGARPDLYALAAATRLDDRRALLGIADQAFDYAKGQASSNLGTALHGFLERKLAGEEFDVPEPWRGDVAAVAAAFQDAGIRLRPELQELVVVRPDLKDGDANGLAGRFDLLTELAGELRVTDYKTGSDPLAYGSWKIQQQLGLYGTGWAVWDGEFWRPMPAIRRDKILMVHVLPGQASVRIHEGDVDPVELEADLAAAYRTRRRRKEAKKAWRPLVTVEDGVVLAGEPAADAVEAVKRGGTIQVTDQMMADAERAEERFKKAAGLDPHEPPPGAEPGALTYAEAAAGPGDVDRTILNGEGKELAPLANPAAKERGCSLCHRKGHRKGSAACLGDADPDLVQAERVKAFGSAKVAELDRAAHVHQDWTRNPMSGSWECGVEDCGHPAAEPVQAELTAAQVELQNAELAPDVPDSGTSSLAAEEQAAVLVHEGPGAMPGSDGVSAEPDPFAEDDGLDELASDSPWHSYLDRINEAKDKATIRTIREEAKALNLWDDALHQAGLARLRSL